MTSKSHKRYSTEQGVWSRHQRALAQAFQLTGAESAIAREALKGRTNREIAVLFGLSRETVNAHLDAVFRKAHVRGRGELAAVLLARM